MSFHLPSNPSATVSGNSRWSIRVTLLTVAALTLGGRELRSQDRPAKRVASIVGVAVEEYAKAVDANGKLVSDIEYEEAVSFLGDAREVAQRLSGVATLSKVTYAALG